MARVNQISQTRDEQSLVKLENMSQKTNNREFTQRPIAVERLSHNANLETILYPQQIYKRRNRSKHF